MSYEDWRIALPESWKLATMHGTAAETAAQALKARAEVSRAIASLDKGENWPPRAVHEQLAAMRGVRLCRWCQDRHFRPYPEQAASSCNEIKCECWCTQGTGQ